METYHFRKMVGKDGSLLLSGLPPTKEVVVVVLEPTDLPIELENWLNDIRLRHPFAQMSKEAILEKLHQTRETLWVERHAS